MTNGIYFAAKTMNNDNTVETEKKHSKDDDVHGKGKKDR